MKETFREIGKQLLSIIRLISFLPIAFASGILVRTIFSYVLIFTTFGVVNSSNLSDFYRGPAIWLSLIGWITTYYISYFIKPKFVTPKGFIISWSAVIGLFAAITLKVLIDPPIEGYPVHKDVIKTLIPIAVLIYFVKDKNNGLYGLEERRKTK